MPRPKDLPKPVRHHAAHENLMEKWKTRDIPGPGTYSVSNPRDQRLGRFSKSTRFHAGQLVPGDLRTGGERDNAVDTPGPIYNIQNGMGSISSSSVQQGKTKGVPMTTAERFRDNVRAASEPGPGAYPIHSDWKKGVSFTKGRRNPNRGLADGHTPTSTTYSPKIVKKVRGGTWAKATGNIFSRETRNTEQEDAPSQISLQAMERATNFTKIPFQKVSFTEAERFSGGGGGTKRREEPFDNVGPGTYNIDRSDKARRVVGKGASFGQASKKMQKYSSNSGGYVLLPNPELLSTHGTAPSIGFSKASAPRGVPNDADTDVPAAIYNVASPTAGGSLEGGGGVGGGKKIATTFGTAPKFPPSHDETPGPGPAASGLNIPTTVGTGPKMPFTKASKNTTSFRDLINTAPGPGSYEARPKRRPDSAGQTIGRGTRPDISTQAGARSREEVPAPNHYNPRFEATRPKSAQAISIHRSDRKVGSSSSAAATGPGAAGSSGDYTPHYEQIDKNKRGAILYFTG